MADLNGQAQAAVSQQAQYVTIFMGANDACTSSVANMTPTGTFQAQFQQALGTLRAGLPNATIFVASIPNVYHLWEVGHTNPDAVATWNALQICHSLLANPTSMRHADVVRRQQVLTQIEAYNNTLSQVCQKPSCTYDNGAVFRYQFGLNLVSTWDYFHPNEAGQATLASVTWSVVKAVWGLSW